MDTAVLIWIIIGIIVVALIVIGAVYFMRNRTQQRERAAHEKAEKLRADARASELAARDGEARAAQAKADAASAAAAAQQAQARAAQADVDANRLADSVGEHEAEANKLRAEQQQTLRKADEVDPYVTTDGAGRTAAVGTDRTTDARRADVDRDGRADVHESPRMGADREGVADVDENQPAIDKDGQPITRPPASRPVPTVTQTDATAGGEPQTRRDRV